MANRFSFFFSFLNYAAVSACTSIPSTYKSNYQQTLRSIYSSKLIHRPSMTIQKDALHNETTLKQFLSFLKRIQLWNNNFVPGILLLGGRFQNLWHALIYEANQFSLSLKMANLDSLKCMRLTFSYEYKCMHLNAG